MKIIDNIRAWIGRDKHSVIYDNNIAFGIGDWGCSKERFADLVFYNICDLLTDICSSVEFIHKGGDLPTFAGFKTFFDVYGKLVLNAIFKRGYVVIGRKMLENGQYDTRLFLLNETQYGKVSRNDGAVEVQPHDKSVQVYVMRSVTMMLEGKSDKDMLKPFLQLLDNVLNGTNTISERLGSAVIMSPQQASGMPMPTVLTKQEKEEMEKELGEKYGYLRNQRSVLLLPSPMNVQTLNLAGLDNKMLDKVKTAILAICDRIKVPANQVGIIDANSSKSFANGTELREGDIIKYRNFRRLLNATFYQFAYDLGLQVDYIIENEPKSDADSILLRNTIKKNTK